MAASSIKTGEEEKEIYYLSENYLAGYQQVKFDEQGDYDMETKRITMAIKYHTARQTHSEELALILLNKDLGDYDNIRRNRPQSDKLHADKLELSSPRQKFKSGLKSVDDVLKYIKPLPCQSDPLKSCKKTVPSEQDIEILVKYFGTNSELQQPIRSERCLANEQEHYIKRQEKREQFTELYDKYSRKHGKTRGDDHVFPRSPVKREINEEPRKVIQPFKSGRELYSLDQKSAKKPKKTLGGKASINKPFVIPSFRRERQEEEKSPPPDDEMEVDDERLKNIDPKMIENIRNEIMDPGSLVKWEDIAGLETTKNIIKEVIIYPMLRPDIFQGLRRPPKGILLFGPPGTGKTLIGKCIASQSNSTFFSISASSLTSKWIGEGEKMVRALFAVARVHQPAVIFIDEIDSLLTQRSETEHESSRRMKTEFLVQLDGAATGDDDRILVIGATNRPHELDEAARRRFVKRLYVPLPEHHARRQIIMNLLASVRHELSDDDIENISAMAEHYSGADMANLCKEASMGPIRSISFEQLEKISKEDVRGVTASDFKQALSRVRPSVSHSDLGNYVQWNTTYGSGIV